MHIKGQSFLGQNILSTVLEEVTGVFKDVIKTPDSL